MVTMATYLGDDLTEALVKAQELSKEFSDVVEFDFSGKSIRVNPYSNLKNIKRDYFTSFTLGWEIIGPYPMEEYDEGTLQLILEAEEEARLKREVARKIEAERARKHLSELTSKIEGIVFDVKDQEMFESWYNKNANDSYGKGTFDYAMVWARVMQAELKAGNTLNKEMVNATSYFADTEGVTGFMRGMAKSILMQCWFYGDDLADILKED